MPSALHLPHRPGGAAGAGARRLRDGAKRLRVMKLYQLHRTHDAGESAGYEYFTARRGAERALAVWRRNSPGDVQDQQRLYRDRYARPDQGRHLRRAQPLRRALPTNG